MRQNAASQERTLILSQDQITLDGHTVSEGDSGAVTVGHDIV